jgi:glycine/D-amino acid oxidase-like deaminating enzyme/nitrite reductase/ring-hydroxylating ferredoxin subunit
MISDSGDSVSVWMATAEVPKYPVLTDDTRADVCVVGAGISGLTTAYFLAKCGKSVVVLERSTIAADASGRTTAHLSNAIDDRYVELERVHGENGARLAAMSHTEAIDTIENIVREEDIECDFTRLDGYLFCPPGESTQILLDEMEAARKAGVAGVRMADRAPIPGFDTGPALVFPRQGQFHVLNYLSGLAKAIERLGGRIFMGTHVSDVTPGDHPVVKTDGGASVACDAVVIATNSPIVGGAPLHGKQAPYRTYVIGAKVPKGAVERALFWDTPDPYHYVRLESVEADAGDDLEREAEDEYDVLIVGGEDHRTGTADDAEARYARLESWTRERFPMIQSVDFRWSGQVLETVDYLAFIGPSPAGMKNVYVATGDSGHGMTHGTIAGVLLADWILGRRNPYADLYSPSRSVSWFSGEALRENISTASQYAAYVTPGDVSSVEEIHPGEGAILRRGLSKLAVYRDEAGVLHECSAVCTHAGGIVRWNHSEKCWDCPVHGSRFDQFGAAIAGPATEDLKPVDVPEEEREPVHH